MKIGELLKNQIGSTKCFCGKEDDFKLKSHKNGVHVGLYCKTCKTWIKWVEQSLIVDEVEAEEAQVNLL